MGKLKEKLKWALAICLICTQSFAADIWVNGSDIYYEGEVEESDYNTLKRIINTNMQTNRLVITNSPGGSLHTGIFIGHLLFDTGFETYITDECHSACNWIFAGGHVRDMDARAVIGLHSPSHNYPSSYYTTRELQDVEQRISRGVYQTAHLLLKTGVSIHSLELMSSKAIYELYIMRYNEARRYNFVNK